MVANAIRVPESSPRNTSRYLSVRRILVRVPQDTVRDKHTGHAGEARRPLLIQFADQDPPPTQLTIHPALMLLERAERRSTST